VGRVRIELDEATSEIRFWGYDESDVRWTELHHLALINNGLPNADGFVVPLLGFRRACVDLARALDQFDPGEIEIAAAVEQVMRMQLGEIRARRGAEDAATKLSREEMLEAVAASGRFTRELTEQQERDLRRLLALRHGANFSVPGAGKTTALYAVYEALRHRGEVERLLVVAPKNAFGAWELERDLCFTPSQRPVMARLSGGPDGTMQSLESDPEIALISYQLLPNVLGPIKEWARSRGTHVVLDESHRIKAGLQGVLASAALALAEVSVRRDILSGTPLPQAPEDLRPQLEFLWPGQRIMPDLRVVAEAPEPVIAEVERAVRPLYVRTTKNELDLPPLNGPKPILVEMGPLQRELYDVLRSEGARVAARMGPNDKQFFRLLGRHVVRLLQAASNPMLLTQGELVDRDEIKPSPRGIKAWELLRDLARYEQPVKVARAIARADELIADGAKVLIWSSFILNLTQLAQLLARHKPVVLYGEVATGEADDPETREGRIRIFHEDPECRLMIANPAACGEAISLHRACHHAIYLDRTFNAAHFLQSVDRIHRLGLESDQVTTVEVIEAADSIDQRVSHRLKAKIDAMSRILNDPGLAALAYDPEDVVEEFPAGLQPEDIEEIVDHLTDRERA
jgi:SNF2 family DNA or RNA helicase